MYMRVSHFKMKPEAIERSKAKAEKLRSEIMGLPGVVRFTNSMNDDGTGCAVSVNESKAQSDANAAAIQKIWSNFADDLAAPPQITGFEVMHDWAT